MFFLSDAEFKRGKDRRKRKQKMSKLGAAVRLGTASTVGAGLGGLIAIGAGNKGRLIGAGLGAGILGGAAALDHKNSPYSPLGKKNWKAFPEKHHNKKLLGMSMRRIDSYQ